MKPMRYYLPILLLAVVLALCSCCMSPAWRDCSMYQTGLERRLSPPRCQEPTIAPADLPCGNDDCGKATS